VPRKKCFQDFHIKAHHILSMNVKKNTSTRIRELKNKPWYIVPWI